MLFRLLGIYLLLAQLTLGLSWRGGSKPTVSAIGNGWEPVLEKSNKLGVKSSNSLVRPRSAGALNTTTRGALTNSSVHLADLNGKDIWDGYITNEDMKDMFNDRFGLLAFTLGVLAIVLVFLIILTLFLAHHTQKTQAKAYDNLQEVS